MGIPEISVPQERLEVDTWGGCLCHQGPTVLGTQSPVTRVSRDLALGFQGNEKEIMALSVRRTHGERTLRED
jgi:hypothetical protein